MSKTNYSKVEKALEEGMLRMKTESLLEEADALKNPSGKLSEEEEEEHALLLSQLQEELKQLKKEDAKAYKKLAFHKLDLKKLEWKEIQEVQHRLDQYKKELPAKMQVSDQSLIDAEREKHLNKRFNVNDKWIPLNRLSR